VTNIPADIIILWPGTDAGIPTGFTRETALDSKFIKGADADNAGDTGGAATHTHTSPAHTHNLPAHSHTYKIEGVTNWRDENRDNLAPGQNVQAYHSHTGKTDDSAAGNCGATAATYGAASNNPPFKEVIFIKGDGAHPIPNTAMLFFASGNLPDFYAIIASYLNKFIRGATAAGDAGATGGATTHSHNLSHTHTGYSHGHGSTTSSFALQDKWRNQGSWVMCGDHQHTFTPSNANVVPDAFAGSLNCPEIVEPLYKKLQLIQMSTGGDLEPGLIGLWLGDIATIPAGWYLLDGTSVEIDMRNHHIKCANDSSEISTTGGSNTHTHAAQSHQHTTPTHVHAVGALSHVSRNLDCPYGQAYDGLYTDQQHAPFDTDPSSVAFDAANTTANSSNNEPAYVKVHFIMFGKVYTKITKDMEYRVRLNKEKTLNMQYKVYPKKTLSLSMSYEVTPFNWKLIPKPSDE